MGGIKSSKPKKQRKYFHSKALHLKQKGLAGHLAKKLAAKLGRRSLQIRKGDTVKVMRGGKKGTEGKVTGVNYGKGTVLIDKLVRKKADGTEVLMPVQASNLLLVDVDRGDARRFGGKKLPKQERGEKGSEGKEKAPEKKVKAGKPEKKGKEKEKGKAAAGEKAGKGKAGKKAAKKEK